MRRSRVRSLVRLTRLLCRVQRTSSIALAIIPRPSSPSLVSVLMDGLTDYKPNLPVAGATPLVSNCQDKDSLFFPSINNRVRKSPDDNTAKLTAERRAYVGVFSNKINGNQLVRQRRFSKTSSAGTKRASPRSISARRDSASMSQASSIPASSVGSRDSNKNKASCALSSTDNLDAFCSNSKRSCDMLCPPFLWL